MKEFFRKTIESLYEDISSSLFLVLIAVPLIAHLLLLEMAYHLKFILFDTSLVAPFTLVLLVRELLPVLIAVLLIGKLGASLSARIATLNITEQIEAYQLLRYPWRLYWLYPKLLSFFITLFFFLIVGFWVSLLVQGLFNPFGVSLQKFISQTWFLIRSRDFANGFIKAFIFGVIPPLVAVRNGLKAQGGAKQVGDAATQTVVTGCVAIILFDFAVDFIFSYFQ